MLTNGGKQQALVAALFVGIVVLVAYQYHNAQSLQARIASLENQVQQQSTGLQQVVSTPNKQQLQELTKRSTVIAKSQDDLLTGAVAKAAPGVVSVVISKDVPLLQVEYQNPFGDDPYFRDVGIRVPVFRQVGTQKKQVGAGTGFFIRSDGYIITNKHVVTDTTAEYTVLLTSGDKKIARVVYRDNVYDLAVLKIEGSGFPVVTLGSSSTLKLGQTVAAIGNALGQYNNSVSVGIISGLERTIQAQNNQGGIETLTGVIQTDAAINRGNSGGPLLDLRGEAIGVNVAAEMGASNIGFAIPIDVVKTVLNNALQ